MGEWDSLVKLVRDHLPFLDDGVPLAPDAGLTDLGLDSMGTMELLADVEDQFGIVFPDEELTVETFASLGAIWTAVARILEIPSPTTGAPVPG